MYENLKAGGFHFDVLLSSHTWKNINRNSLNYCCLTKIDQSRGTELEKAVYNS